MRSMMFALVAAVSLAPICQQPAVTAPAPLHKTVPSAAFAYIPERVYDTSRKAFSDFEVMVAELASADVVFVGEQHDDPNTHRLEAALLKGLLRREIRPAVSLEMFERDVQGLLDRYLEGTIAEPDFLKASRPWPRYATDYRPLVEIAREKGLPVIASNVPRKYASSVAKAGLAALDALPPAERALIARDIQCPFDTYFDRFSETMNRHPVPGTEKQTAEDRRATTERNYFAQCIKDETMAESIVAELERADRRPGPLVHYNGAFHSDFGAGATERVRRRLTGRRVLVITMLPVANIDTVSPEGEDLTRADYLVYTVRSP